MLSEERVTGTVTTELGTGQQGRISYENRGECFFLPYGKDDVEGNVTLSVGDKVSFQIATSHRYHLSLCEMLSVKSHCFVFFLLAVTWELVTSAWKIRLIQFVTREWCVL